MNKIVIYTDGGARNNPGPAGIGVVLMEGDATVAELKKYIGEQTNNWAEYEALAEALHEAKKRKLGAREIEVRMDSELVVKQMRGEYRVKDRALKEQHTKVRELLSEFTSVHFVHIPREENEEADRLVNEAIDEAQ